MKEFSNPEKNRRQVELRRFEHPLPPVLYHITTKSSAERILAEGLSPSLRLQGDAEVVSMTDDINFGKRVATKTQKVKNPEDLIILQIDTNKLDRSSAESFLEEKMVDVLLPEFIKILEARNPQVLEEHLHEVHYHGVVPPEAISMLD